MRLRRAATAWLAAVAVAAMLAGGAVLADRTWPLDLSRLTETSAVVVDRAGVPLRVFTTQAGLWRLAPDADAVSPAYMALLFDVEDKRFWHHPGFDPLALGRALGQWVARGRVVSGGSTLTMQVVRLLEPRPRTLRSKLIEIVRAAQLEAHWRKRDILRAYLTLAPMGRNLEGVRAGSLAWFGKEPARLSDAEAALLVALPQNPSGLRPDRDPAAAGRARARVLRRATADGLIGPEALASALVALIPTHRQPMPRLAPHLAERLAADAATSGTPIATTLDASLQAGAERLLAQMLDALPRPVTLAAVVADWRTGEVLARVGNAAYGDARRLGAVDMVAALRSPGSTLKPFIYGLAFEGLLAHPGSLVGDVATRFDDYAPHNFDGAFNGDVTVRQALQSSLNLPAVVVLQRVGPVAFTERFKAAGLPLELDDPHAAPGLPVALGGAGTTLEHLVSAYAALADGGAVRPLADRPGPAASPGASLMTRSAADAVVDILSDMPAPPGTGGRAGRIAYKTGTSYRFRDGWAVGFNNGRVAGIWMGRADGGSCSNCVGASAAAILFGLFDLMTADPLPKRALAPVFAGPPPAALLRLDAKGGAVEEGPRITFPVSQSRILVDLDAAPGFEGAVKLAATGGERPYRWLVDGRPVASRPFAHESLWRPDGEGFSTIAVVDAAGHADRVTVRVSGRAGG